ncbi:2,3-diaminopropionate biosynthesis protein SbnA [Streptomyces cucumeris]|uniref:2,3-diaminopropionate biosynthesis protein SbnA n=1 Tax=Streptomyces cucumeris TaxID=2962890 RepID=UPI0020C8CE0A|nr:2,3-diaminopropionate biosynthesis protein SbnA [Streptomyces sp. NEAU-Y11]MCP9211173.1 2,3-diaminopropionate biosynthesis protein SbnA [Streptomyces sp. NEAU-Y11]
MIHENAYDVVTNDIYLRLSDIVPSSDFILKLEGLNPAGSIKLKTARGMVEQAETSGALRPGTRVIESSSGSLGVALAMVCAAKGHAFTCVTDPHASRQSVQTMRALGAEVVEVAERDVNGGYLGTRIAYIHALLSGDDDAVWLNQYANPENSRVHEEHTAAAILEELPIVDYLFVGAGTTGTVMGCTSYFGAYSPLTKVVAVDTLGSVTFGHPPGPRHVPGLGASRRPEICRPEAVDDIVLISEEEAIAACRELARSYGVLVGGSTGSVVAAVRNASHAIPAGSVVVGISPDLGERYVGTVYDDDWVTARFGSLPAGLATGGRAVAADVPVRPAEAP